MNAVSLAPEARETIARTLEAAYPDEGCGLLIGTVESGRAVVDEAVPCANEAPEGGRADLFVIDPKVVIDTNRRLRGSGRALLGFFHSHPDAEARPSRTDMGFLRLWPETAWLIVPVRGGRADTPRAWWLDDADADAARELAVE